MAMNPIVESKNITLNKHKYSTVEGFYIFFSVRELLMNLTQQ